MEFRKTMPSCEEARQMDIVSYLSSLGYNPAKIRNFDYWYHSPLRDEKTPSFKVNRKLNRWYDHGIGKGGNLIDFAILYNSCTVGEFLRTLGHNVSFQQPISTSLIKEHHTTDSPIKNCQRKRSNIFWAPPLFISKTDTVRSSKTVL